MILLRRAATSDSDMNASIGQDLYGRFADEACAQQ
jgi:hypothetical protein